MNAKFPISRKQESCSYKLSSFPQILIESEIFPTCYGTPCVYRFALRGRSVNSGLPLPPLFFTEENGG